MSADAFGNALGQGLVDATRPGPAIAVDDQLHLFGAATAVIWNGFNPLAPTYSALTLIQMMFSTIRR